MQLQIEMANTFLARFRGLMLRKRLPAGHGLLIAPCNSTTRTTHLLLDMRSNRPRMTLGSISFRIANNIIAARPSDACPARRSTRIACATSSH